MNSPNSRGKKPPALAQMPRELQGFVLGEAEYTPKPGIEAVREREVDDAIVSAERNGGLGRVPCQRREALASAAGKKDRHHMVHVDTSIGFRFTDANCDSNR